jgi:hypothetical protein
VACRIDTALGVPNDGTRILNGDYAEWAGSLRVDEEISPPNPPELVVVDGEEPCAGASSATRTAVLRVSFLRALRVLREKLPAQRSLKYRVQIPRLAPLARDDKGLVALVINSTLRSARRA